MLAVLFEFLIDTFDASLLLYAASSHSSMPMISCILNYGLTLLFIGLQADLLNLNLQMLACVFFYWGSLVDFIVQGADYGIERRHLEDVHAQHFFDHNTHLFVPSGLSHFALCILHNSINVLQVLILTLVLLSLFSCDQIICD